MAISFSQLFSSSQTDIATAESAGSHTSVSDDGAAIEAESYSRSDDGSTSYERTSADTGESKFAGGADGDRQLSGDNEAASSSSNAGDGSSGGRSSDNDGTDSADNSGANGSRSDQSGEADGEVSNSGIIVERESYSRDEDGSESYHATSTGTGETNIGFDLEVGNMAHAISSLSSTSEDEASFE